MQEKVIVYISGAYTASSKEKIAKNIQKAESAAIKIWNNGGAALCPHLNTRHFERTCKATYEDYMQGDIQLLEGCDVIYMLPGWEKSNGAKMEHDHAVSKNIMVFTDMEKLINFLQKPSHSRCAVTGKIRKVYTYFGDLKVDALISDKLNLEITKEVNLEMKEYRRKFIPVPRI